MFDVTATGRLDPLTATPILPGAHLYNLAVVPGSAFVYATDPDLGTISGFALDRVDGGLTPVPGSPLQIGGFCESVAIDPSGTALFTANGTSVGVYAIDSTTGELGDGGPPIAVTGNAETIAFDPSGRFIYVSHGGQDGIEVFTRDGGSYSRVAGSPFGVNEVQGGAMVIHPNGWLYNARFNLNGFTTDPANGAFAKIGGSPFSTTAGSDSFAKALALDPTGRFLYVVESVNSAFAVFSIAPGNGALTLLGSVPLSGAYSVAVDPTGQFLYAGSDFGHIAGYALEASDGGVAELSTSPYAVSGLQPEIVIVPR